MIFRSTVSGGNGGYGLFVGSTSGLRKVVTNGDPNPFSDTFALMSSTSVGSSALVKLNNAGQVAFVDGNALFLHTPASGLVGAVSAGMAAPAPLDARTISAIASIGAFNDSGVILFVATLAGSTTNNLTCLRYVSGSPLAMVAYKGQAAPGASGQAFDTFASLTLNNAGDAAFSSTLSPSTPSTGGLFSRPAGGGLSLVVLEGTTAPAGGTYRTTNYCRLAPNGSLYFESYMRGGSAMYGSFLAAAGGVQALVTDLNPLPAGARLTLRTLFPKGAGTQVGFLARRAGGHLGIFGHVTAGGITWRAFVDGDFVGDLAARVSLSTNLIYMATDGSVVFAGVPNWSSGPFIIRAHPNGDVAKIVGPGDPVPEHGRDVRELHAAIDARLADERRRGDRLPRYLLGRRRAVPGQDRVPDDRVGGAQRPAGADRRDVHDQHLHQLPAQRRGPGRLLRFDEPGRQRDLRGVAGCAGRQGGRDRRRRPRRRHLLCDHDPRARELQRSGNGGLLRHVERRRWRGPVQGSASAAPQAVAVNGTAAPAGGNYLFTSSSKDARINAFGDILFQAPLSGIAISGMFFVRAASGTTVALALGGDTAPGTSYPFSPIATTVNSIPGEFTALGPNRRHAWF